MRKFALFVFCFSIFFSLAALFAMPFLISWGASPGFFKKLVMFVMTSPIDWLSLIIKKSLLYVILGGVFWGVLSYAIIIIFLFLIAKMKSKYGRIK